MTDTLRLAHLSDAHLPGPLPRGSEWLGKRGLSALNWLRSRRRLHLGPVADAVAADLAAHRPDLVAMTGDLVNFSLAREFEAGAAWLARLGPPDRVLFTPGNHDALVPGWRGRLSALAGVAEGPLGTGTPFLRRAGPVALAVVSTGIATPPFVAAGHVGRAARARLGALIAAARGEGLLPVVLMHHPPTRITVRRKGLADGDAVRAVLADAGAGLVLHGHTHAPDLSWIDGPHGRLPVIGVPSASMRPGGGHAAGAWRLVTLSRAADGWRAEIAERAVTAEGGIEARAPLILALPGPAPCDAPPGA